MQKRAWYTTFAGKNGHRKTKVGHRPIHGYNVILDGSYLPFFSSSNGLPHPMQPTLHDNMHPNTLTGAVHHMESFMGAFIFQSSRLWASDLKAF